MEIASLIVAILSLAVAIIAIIIANNASAKANKIAQGELGVSYGTIELEMRKAISDQSERISDLSLQTPCLIVKSQNQTITVEESAQLGALQASIHAAIQNYLNTYDDACAKYIDGKIDKARFKKSFNVEIRNLLERPSLKLFFDPHTSRYKAIIKVYNEWENLEQ